jgi:hypothetical protein
MRTQTKGFKMKWQTGDEVKWNDPDGGACSRTGTILTIEEIGDGAVALTMTDGWHSEVLLTELE